ncbi:hypothetical protein CHU92_01625 [Flavobacterium cyanobacteriorum]|uniref:Fibronectin type-III domain-containing protein n=1 Tax=Flavobacterium cyanobacteriorum TaxID=2022802 RepID=A0A255ZXL6_9FLAO|nr:T9SS type A sorting domain-containing protein [Flavobacterium cyanobacteriorum]OYQ46129.1 hypothetical protein CHU92_01625 [Flavobacterium cyanobacteriorum]
MKKQLLLGTLFLGSLFNANAQLSCGAATVIPTTGGTFSAPAVTGTFPTGTAAQICTFADGNATTPAALWYSFTPTQSGLLTIDTGIAANPVATTDTRVRVLSGSCLGFTCVAQNDDISATDFRTRISNLAVSAGTTYFIVWDNRWSAAAFSFQITFTAQSCFAPTAGFQYTSATTTSVGISWTAPTLGTPTGYQVEYGPIGFTQGTGTILDPTPTAPNATFTQLTPGTVYSFYVRSVCGAGNFSNWTGPISFNSVFPPANIPYSMGFEGQTNVDFLGWSSLPGTTGTDWDIESASTTYPAQEGTNVIVAGRSGGASDAWLFSRPINLTGGQQVTLSYFMRKIALAGAGNVNNLQVTWGNAATVAAQTNTLATYNDYASTTYEQKTHTFTPNTTGTYVIGFRYTAPAHVNTNFGVIALDNIVVNATAGTNEALASKLSVFPNPATNVINIANAENILVNGVEIADLNGRIVKSVKFNNVAEAQINVSDLSAGMYLMTVSSDQGTMTKKIVKQ